MNSLRGSCHCGAVAFEVDFEPDEDDPPYFRCNCSLCARKGSVMAAVPKVQFRLLAGEEVLSLYQWNTLEAKHWFCNRCGIHTHYVPRGADDEVGFNAACVDALEVFKLAAVPMGNGAWLSTVDAPARPAAAGHGR